MSANIERRSDSDNIPMGIYVHIPFCRKACHYCNFHFSTNLKHVDRMVDAIVSEIEMRRNEFINNNVETLYFGGGTPSLLNGDQLNRILTALNLNPENLLEVTIEANPDDITTERIQVWESLGIHRVSLGIQSFLDRDLKWMNRTHNSEEAHTSLELLKKADFRNVSLDLIYGIPGSTMDEWKSNIARALEFEPEHISCYQLTVEENTALHHMIKQGKTEEKPDEFIVRQFDYIMNTLVGAGYDHYEISNFAQPNQRALHNTRYWDRVPYSGFGPGAHSFRQNVRSWNISHNPHYIQAIEQGKLPSEKEFLTEKDQYNEWILTGLRREKGLETEKLQEFPKYYRNHFSDEIDSLINKGWIYEADKTYTLTQEGKHWVDRASMHLMTSD